MGRRAARLQQRGRMRKKIDQILIKGSTKTYIVKEFIKGKVKQFFNAEQDGIGVVEIILIIVVLISLVVLFRQEITKIIQGIFNKITSDTTSYRA